MQMRAKFRVLDINQNHSGVRTFLLRPVDGKSAYNAEGSEENLRWWTATPSGEMTIRVPADHEFPAGLREAVFVDFEPSEDKDGWRMTGANLRPEDGQMDVTFQSQSPWGSSVKLGIGNRDTIAHLLPILIGRVYGPAPTAPPTRWAVTFSAAPG